MEHGWDLAKRMKDKKKKKKRDIVVGPWGGNGGFIWDDGAYTGVREITLRYGSCIDSITLVYDNNGEQVVSEKHGGNGGRLTAEIKLEYPEEFLVCVSGHYFPRSTSTPVIRSLIFRSNLRSFGPYGVEEGTPFTFPMEGGQITGFKGRCGRFLDAIGFYIASAPTKPTIEMAPKDRQKHRRPPPYHIQHSDPIESSSS